MENVELEFEFDDGEKFTRSLSNSGSSFNVEYVTAEDIKSGEHNVVVKARAEGGNYGVTNLNFSIKAKIIKINELIIVFIIICLVIS